MNGITDAQLAVLASLAGKLDAGTYLAGGVALATAYGHRSSFDLDLFVAADFDAERLAEHVTASVPRAIVTGRAPRTLHLEVDGVPTSILSYRYPLLRALEHRPGLPIAVASMDDLACMKVSAIAGRGAAKDFWDLDVILEHGAAGGDLPGVLERYGRKFASEDIGHAVRALAYFADADAAPLPAGLAPAHWKRLKASFAARVRALE
ncbi:MAG TPA: nucleotidyl transferase AbiEii/AbiGii toxin family protein [Polyangiaceae bacterium]|nr:nucleotidyl transferase AbiEii/AbiGii toxin family protein [Polyangiaceae bacterium]